MEMNSWLRIDDHIVMKFLMVPKGSWSASYLELVTLRLNEVYRY
jgi:hypothetical protein